MADVTTTTAPPDTSDQCPRCICWIGRGDQGGDSKTRMACPVHGDAAPRPAAVDTTEDDLRRVENAIRKAVQKHYKWDGQIIATEVNTVVHDILRAARSRIAEVEGAYGPVPEDFTRCTKCRKQYPSDEIDMWCPCGGEWEWKHDEYMARIRYLIDEGKKWKSERDTARAERDKLERTVTEDARLIRTAVYRAEAAEKELAAIRPAREVAADVTPVYEGGMSIDTRSEPMSIPSENTDGIMTPDGVITMTFDTGPQCPWDLPFDSICPKHGGPLSECPIKPMFTGTFGGSYAEGTGPYPIGETP